MNVHVLDRDLLLALAAMVVQRIKQQAKARVSLPPALGYG
jgi:hypothetical protein